MNNHNFTNKILNIFVSYLGFLRFSHFLYFSILISHHNNDYLIFFSHINLWDHKINKYYQVFYLTILKLFFLKIILKIL